MTKLDEFAERCDTVLQKIYDKYMSAIFVVALGVFIIFIILRMGCGIFFPSTCTGHPRQIYISCEQKDKTK